MQDLLELGLVREDIWTEALFDCPGSYLGMVAAESEHFLVLLLRNNAGKFFFAKCLD